MVYYALIAVGVLNKKLVDKTPIIGPWYWCLMLTNAVGKSPVSVGTLGSMMQNISFPDTLLMLQEYPAGAEDRGLQKEPLKTVKDGKRVYYDSVKVRSDNSTQRLLLLMSPVDIVCAVMTA